MKFVNELLQLLRNGAATASVVHTCLVYLQETYFRNEAVRVEAYECGAMGSVLHVLQLHAKVADVQAAGWSAVSSLLVHHGAQEALSGGAVSLALAALRAHPGHAGVQANAMWVLRQMLQAEAGAVDEARASGAAEAAVAALRMCHSCEDAASNIAAVLFFVAHNDEATALQACSAGALPLVLAALEAHKSSQRATSALLLLLSSMLPRCASAVLRADALNATLAAHAAFTTDEVLQDTCSYLLQQMAPDLSAADRGRVLQAALPSMRTDIHAWNPTVVWNAVTLLRNLMEGDGHAELKDTAVQSGVIKSLMAIVGSKQHPSGVAADLLSVGFAALYDIVADGRHADAAIKAGALQCALDALRTHTAKQDVYANALSLLIALARGSCCALIRAGVLELKLASERRADCAELHAKLLCILQAPVAQAERAAAELLAEVAAERWVAAAGGTKKKSRAKAPAVHAAAAAANAGGSGGMQHVHQVADADTSADVASTASAAGQAEPAAAAPQPSALAARRRRRAATKAARRRAGPAVSSGNAADDAAPLSDEEASQGDAPGPPAAALSATEAATGAADADAAGHAASETEMDAPELESLFSWMRVGDGAEAVHDAAPAAAAAASPTQVPTHGTPTAAPAHPLPPLPAGLVATPLAAEQQQPSAAAHAAPALAVAAAPAAPDAPRAAAAVQVAQQQHAAMPAPAVAAAAPLTHAAALTTAAAACTAAAAACAAAAAHVTQLEALLEAQLDATKCVVCLHAPRCTGLLPCRHLLLCSSADCFAMLGAPPLCPLCRQRVTDTLQWFV